MSADLANHAGMALRARMAHAVRRGVSAVELAVCMPLIALVAVGSIEATNGIFLKQRLTCAAYETARSAIAPGQTNAAAVSIGQNVLTQFSISGGSITISPTVSSSTSAGTQITVTATAPFGANSCMSSFIIAPQVTTVTAVVVMDHQ